MKRTTYLALDDGNLRAARSTISLSIADEQNKRARSPITSLTKTSSSSKHSVAMLEMRHPLVKS